MKRKRILVAFYARKIRAEIRRVFFSSTLQTRRRSFSFYSAILRPPSSPPPPRGSESRGARPYRSYCHLVVWSISVRKIIRNISLTPRNFINLKYIQRRPPNAIFLRFYFVNTAIFSRLTRRQ